ncbi:substrate-binding domain-containing protein (plasmid) [Agrobacterium tumefaciens]|uniref:Substrate-binding domain-containing protein n=1 Tax=Agrobacterium tumefaciens TaxID=358 RepID=A0AAP9EA14_AGRTU|nr:substrate-binding domain-containing protein [Agrobacterium tumefaciens]NSZ60074.1 substrate-binding domain-containing protein [Agrobacterium tumefaciens]QDY97674.1 substrate-binding domain-containing protein [Agrobacterium tumefaciens]UXS12797.1 substrate-binding domain-containing protein [Agrobacterium tumefaciens]UXS20158.1 substrate-binding domain-containing protein [Agrobacterium tumefaciens]UXS27806.1 substrate-binding domain-containing protein [Agrobacterium tumefaciens]
MTLDFALANGADRLWLRSPPQRRPAAFARHALVSQRVGGSSFPIPRRQDPIRIGLLVPFQGADAIWGPSCQYSAVLAAAELNEKGGILGRPIELLAADAGGSPQAVVKRARDLVDNQGAHALVGVHLSSVRVELSQALAGCVPYVFAPLFEGSAEKEQVFSIGEVPQRQFSGPVSHFMDHHRADRWFLIGNDYVWPRASHNWVRDFVRRRGGKVVGEEYVGLGQDTSHLLDLIDGANPDIVFLSLVGSECVPFNRMFAERGLSGRILRLSGAIEENTLLAIGGENTENLFCAAGYFSALQTPENRTFLQRYRDAFGVTAPVQGVLSEACYEGLRFFGALAAKAQSLKLDALSAAFEGLSFESPRGITIVRNGVASGPTYLARADGAEFEVVRTFDAF